MKYRQSGFTLIELMMAIAIMAIVVSMAIPSFQKLIATRVVASAVDAMSTDLRYARSEAVKRSARVSLCRRSTTSTTETCAGSTGKWKDGWIVFVDADGNGSFDSSNDELLRVQQDFASISSIQGTTPSGDRSAFTYQPTGWAISVGQAFFFTPVGATTSEAVRLLCISNQGRPSLQAVGTTTCP